MMGKPAAVLVASLLTIVGLGGCAYQGGFGNPLERKLSWYSYIGGDDIRDTCMAGQGDAIRLVYNAIHTEQIRTYDIAVTAHDETFPMDARVLGPASLGSFETNGAFDPIAPWRGDTATTRLRAEDLERLWDALAASGTFDPAPEGLYLPSEKFFWLTAVCRDGRFFYNAFRWPSDAFDGLQFDNMVFAWDMTGVAVNPPRQATNFDIYGDASPTRKTGAYYHVTVGKNGLKRF